MVRPSAAAGCSSLTSLRQQRLLNPVQAAGMASLFKVLASETRIRILHALIRADELCVTELAATIGMKAQAVSNQIQRLADLGIVAARREGNLVHYRVIDVCVRSLLEQGFCLMKEVSVRRRQGDSECEM